MLRAAILGLAILGAATPALADPFDDVLAAHPDFSGAVLVEKDGAILFDKAYGMADEARGIPNRTTTSFHLGSLSMLFTDLAILHLANVGKLSLDNTAGQFLPGAPALRIRDLVGDNDPAHHVLLARIAAAATGKPFVDFAGAYVFSSVWENGTGWDDGTLGRDSRFARGTGTPAPDWAAVLGGDGAYSTTRDTLHWIGALYDDGLVLKEPSPALPASRQPGFGWTRGQEDFALAGAGSGFEAAIRARPESRLTVIVLANRAGAGSGGIAAALEQAAGKP
jgi:CubicO group peptidase (beta-lactamase class C family)